MSGTARQNEAVQHERPSVRLESVLPQVRIRRWVDARHSAVRSFAEELDRFCVMDQIVGQFDLEPTQLLFRSSVHVGSVCVAMAMSGQIEVMNASVHHYEQTIDGRRAAAIKEPSTTDESLGGRPACVDASDE